MKHLLSLSIFAFVVLAFASCTKDNSKTAGLSPVWQNNQQEEEVVTDPYAWVKAVPADFTKKVVLEEFTGEWCGWCPEGAKVMEDNVAANPGRVVGIAVHDGDPMEIPSFNTWIKGLTGVSGYPNGSVDRADASSRGSWTGQITTELAKAATCGLAMVSTLNGDAIDVNVYVGYNTPITGNTKLTLAVIENDVPQSPGGQSNYSSSVVVDANWQHSHVLRGIITAEQGDDIKLNESTNYTKVEFKNIDLSGMKINDMKNVHLAAFININDAGKREVLNAQECGLNEEKKWD
ncbi:MAG: Omp28-related outer membrane protein [Chitinophagaceae bacterium]